MVEKAQAQLADYKRRYLPLQRNMAAQIDEMGKADSVARQSASGRSAVETEAKFGRAQGAVEKSLTNSGRGPGSAAFNLGVTGFGEDKAASKSAGFVAADQAIDNAYVQGLGALTALGRGEKATALQGDAQLAAMSGRQATEDANVAAAARGSNMQLAGYGLGVGLNAAMTPAKSNIPQSVLNAANQSPDPIGSLNSSMGWTP